jgi:tripartite ATP-independent transporter DctM subunit
MPDWIEAVLLLLGGVTALIVLGPPVAFAFLAVNIVGAFLFLGGDPGLKQLARNSVASLNNFSLTPIPFFILMGEVLFHSGVAMKAIDAVDLAIRRVPGRLAIVAIVAGTVFSAISGSTIATTAMLGSLLLPQMLERGYERKMAMGPIMAIGGVDVLIPPSALTVLLGSLAGISISGLLVGGIVPGAIMSALFIGYVAIRCGLNPSLAPAQTAPSSARGHSSLGPLLVHLAPLVAIFGAVVGSMLAGWATPTESGALGAMATIAIAALYRQLTPQALLKALMGTVAISGAILFILMGAVTFSQILSFSGATSGLVGFIQGAGLSPTMLLVGMLVILLILGCFIDQVSMMLITLPFYMPIVKDLNLDPVWFGILFLICMQIGLLTPPFGLLLFVMKSAAPPDIRLSEVYAAAAPYVLMMMLMLGLVFAFPWLATGLAGLAR